MSDRLSLAESSWPRTGRDRRNSSLAPFQAASTGEIVLDVQLPFQGAVVVAENGDYLISGGNQLAAISSSGDLLWTRRLSQPCSAPMALAGGGILINGRGSSYLLDSRGESLKTWTIPSYGLDDSGPSPTLTETGYPLFSGIHGEVWIGREDQVDEIGAFGYDVLPPAVLVSGEIAIAGYACSGACLVTEEGQILWERPDFEDADSLVSVNRFSEIAFGNLNEKATLVVDRAGRDLFKVPFFAVFSEHPDGWVATSVGHVCLLSRTGSQVWENPIKTDRKFRVEQAACDVDGNIYVSCTGGLVAFDRTGNLLFETQVAKEHSTNVALVKNRAVFVCGSRLFAVG